LLLLQAICAGFGGAGGLQGREELKCGRHGDSPRAACTLPIARRPADDMLWVRLWPGLGSPAPAQAHQRGECECQEDDCRAKHDSTPLRTKGKDGTTQLGLCEDT
jgi:hypothetical protein